MKKRSILLLTCLAVFGLLPLNSAFGYFITSNSDPALSGGSVIDFQSQTVAQYTSLTIGSVTFTALDSHLHIAEIYSGSFNMQGHYLENNNLGFHSLQISFNSPVQAFGFNLGPFDYQWTLAAYDAGNNLLESYNLPIDVYEFRGIAASNIMYVNLTYAGPNNNFDWVMIDNFTSGVVPLPGAVYLFCSGLLGLVGLRRFRKG